jgi:hypothetical protein
MAQLGRISSAREVSDRVKDRLGDQRGGSEWEPIKIILVNHCKPRELVVASANLHSWLGSHVVPAQPWFWGSTKKPSTTSSCCSCHMRPALDPTCHRVPRTKPTCLLHTRRPHRRWPFALVLHLPSTSQAATCTCNNLAKNQSTQRCQSLITQGSDHPPVLEPCMVLTGWASLTTPLCNCCWSASRCHQQRIHTWQPFAPFSSEVWTPLPHHSVCWWHHHDHAS